MQDACQTGNCKNAGRQLIVRHLGQQLFLLHLKNCHSFSEECNSSRINTIAFHISGVAQAPSPTASMRLEPSSSGSIFSPGEHDFPANFADQ